MCIRSGFIAVAIVVGVLSAGNTAVVWAEEASDNTEADLAKQTQNPVSNMISLPFQYNIDFNAGPHDRTKHTINIQPVYPISLSSEWNLITRTILPVVDWPAPIRDDSNFGLSDMTVTAFLSPAQPGKWIWGAGPVFMVPTATKDVLGTEKWGAGPSAVVLSMSGPWVYGALINQIWSFAGDSDRADVSRMLLQPFLNYNMPNGWYLSSGPIITADWEASSSNTWTIPLGGGLGKIFKVGKQPMNATIQGYYNVEKPSNGPDWTLRLQLQMLFPK